MNTVQSTGHAGGGGMGKKDSQIEVSRDWNQSFI